MKKLMTTEQKNLNDKEADRNRGTGIEKHLEGNVDIVSQLNDERVWKTLGSICLTYGASLAAVFAGFYYGSDGGSIEPRWLTTGLVSNLATLVITFGAGSVISDYFVNSTNEKYRRHCERKGI